MAAAIPDPAGRGGAGIQGIGRWGTGGGEIVVALGET